MNRDEAWARVVAEAQRNCTGEASKIVPELTSKGGMGCALDMASGKEGCPPCKAKEVVLDVCVMGEKLQGAQ